ncbi:Methylenetetrahydrofolate reductase [uncultured archaeon]|nr:Methylenetetrahydrofolate reductase [uncultured archaeon]
MTLRKKLAAQQFVVTAELTPPKGTDIKPTLEKLEHLKDADAINITDNNRSIVNMSGLAFSALLVSRGKEPVYQITARDRNRMAIQSDLMGAHALGIHNILALHGDDPSKGDNPQSKAVFDLDTLAILSAVSALNEGSDLAGNKLNAPTDLFPGAACDPNKKIEEELARMQAKRNAGARFFQTQIFYEADKFSKFAAETSSLEVPILAGITPLKSEKMANFLNEKVKGVHVPKELIQEIKESANPEETGIEQAARLIKDIKDDCAGIHVMTIGGEKNLPKLLKLAKI